MAAAILQQKQTITEIYPNKSIHLSIVSIAKFEMRRPSFYTLSLSNSTISAILSRCDSAGLNKTFMVLQLQNPRSILSRQNYNTQMFHG